MSSAPWYRAVLGDELVRWCTPAPGAAVGEPPPLARVAVEEALAGDVEAVALYFPPLLGDDLADRLLELCRSVKGRLRVVQVRTPSRAEPQRSARAKKGVPAMHKDARYVFLAKSRM